MRWGYLMAMSSDNRRILWVRAGGRCTLCKSYLLHGELTGFEVPVGEGAHIVGQAQAERSPRGMSELPLDRRDTPENVLLACANCHNEIDKAKVAEVVTAQMLQERKAAHEAEIRHQTGLTADRRTTVLRMFGAIRGAMMRVDATDAATAVLQSSDRFPLFPASYDQQGLELDLCRIPGEESPTNGYYASAARIIDTFVGGRVADGVEQGHLTHLSVFAIARLPLLVYLGWSLDDGIDTDVYQRHRSTGKWQWPTAEDITTFTVEATVAGAADAAEAVLITNLSGTTTPPQLPEAFLGLPAFTVTPTGQQSHEDVIAHPASVVEFRTAVRRFFSELEASRPSVATLHVFGALPVSAAVSLGQTLKARDLRPKVVLYDLTPTGYQHALEI